MPLESVDVAGVRASVDRAQHHVEHQLEELRTEGDPTAGYCVIEKVLEEGRDFGVAFGGKGGSTAKNRRKPRQWSP
jgi:hypothetical protein